MVQPGVSPGPGGMMVGRPGSQGQPGGQGPMGNSFRFFALFFLYFLKLNFVFFLLSGQMTKAPSTIKTNIKAASQIHPYGR